MAEHTTDHTIFIYRKGNGGAYVHPTPEVVKPRQTVSFSNMTECTAEVDFKQSGVVSQKTFSIHAGESYAVTVIATQKKYHEYKVKLACDSTLGLNEQYAEGASDPGLIVDP